MMGNARFISSTVSKHEKSASEHHVTTKDDGKRAIVEPSWQSPVMLAIRTMPRKS